MQRFLVMSVSALALGASGAMADEKGEILQNGTYGAAYIEQDTETATAFIAQEVGSESDTAAIVQSEAGTDGISATIIQNSFASGYGNVAGIVQTNLDSGSTSGEINQDGSSNTAGIRQRDSGNGALIDQDGDENRAVVKQGDVPPGFEELESDSGNTTTELDFSGTLNFEGTSGGIFAGGQNGPAQNSYGEIVQAGLGNHGAILQLGDTQVATISQDGDGNDARVQQAYELNTAIVEQTGIENSADVLQVGSNNLADVIQDGSYNEALVAQYDDVGDEATVSQTGSDHLGIVHQTADGVVSVALITQSGSSNTGFVNQ